MKDEGHDRMLRGLAAGEEEAFRLLYDRSAGRLFRTALRMLGRPEEAEDAVQEAFLGLVRSRRRLRAVEDLDAYLFASLRNAAARRRASRARESAAVEALGAAAANPAARRDPGPGGSGEGDLERALAALPPEQREVVALKVDGGLTFAEIGAVLGVSPHTAASRYRYALEKLKERMGG